MPPATLFPYPLHLCRWHRYPVEIEVPPEGVLDRQTFEAIEVEALFGAVDGTKTKIGAATLYRSLAQPLVDAETIGAKQHALAELRQNERLRSRVERAISHFAEAEEPLYRLLFGHYLGLVAAPQRPDEFRGFGYDDYAEATEGVVRLVSEIGPLLQEASSPQLKGWLGAIAGFGEGRTFELMRGPAYRFGSRLYTARERWLRFFLPAIRFRPSLLKPLPLIAFFALFYLLPAFSIAPFITTALWIFGLPLLLIFYIPGVGSFDQKNFIYPLRRLYREDRGLQRLLEAVGFLDEALAFLRYMEAFPHPTTLPHIEEADHHRFRAVGLVNPILGKEHPDYVPNDIDLSRARLTFITGPNSGGKTALCKTVCQAQLLAQAGGPVPAREAALTPADRIFYQVPETSRLLDREGRFAYELRRTKEIFMNATPKSLVVLDELAEGTTFKERLEISYQILDGFWRKGCTTILVTHNHELVEKFIQQGIGQAKQVQFRDDRPTYRLIDGISKISHAHRIAWEVGFSREDIERHLREQGHGEPEEGG